MNEVDEQLEDAIENAIFQLEKIDRELTREQREAFYFEIWTHIESEIGDQP